MLIDAFTLFGNWPGLPYTHTIDHVIAGLTRNKLNFACAISSQGIFFDAAAGNEMTVAECRRDPRLMPIGTADPRVNGIEQVDACVKQGIKVMALFPETQHWNVASLAARMVFKRIADANLPLLIEARSEGAASAIHSAVSGMSMPLVLLDVTLQTLTEAALAVRMRPNTFISTRLLCGADTIELLTRSIGADRLVFASNFPIACFSAAFLSAKSAGISDGDRLAIMGKNMAAITGVSAPVAS